MGTRGKKATEQGKVTGVNGAPKQGDLSAGVLIFAFKPGLSPDFL
jgi:hypothetical protein